MKRKDLLHRLHHLGWWLKREGGSHEIMTNGHLTEPVPRHCEINDILAHKILMKAQVHPKQV